MTAPAGSEDAGLVLSAEEVAAIPTHNERAATHEALCRSWIFDVLVGLADLLDEDAARIARTPPPAGYAQGSQEASNGPVSDREAGDGRGHGRDDESGRGAGL